MGSTAKATRKTTAKIPPTPKNHPLSPSLNNAIKKAVKTSKEPTSGIAKTATAGIPIMARHVHKDFLVLILKSGPET